MKDFNLPKVKNFKIRTDFWRTPRFSISRWDGNIFQLLFVEIDEQHCPGVLAWDPQESETDIKRLVHYAFIRENDLME